MVVCFEVSHSGRSCAYRESLLSLQVECDLPASFESMYQTGETGMSDSPKLRRSLSLSLVCLYGVGNILGAGIYVLIGKVAGESGYFTPLAFLLASIVAGITAFSFAELSSRYPVSAGEAVYVQEAFGVKQLSLVVGLLIVLTGVVSSATIAKGFVGYFNVFFDLPASLIIVVLLVTLGLIAVWGILESVSTAAFFTLVEIGGLLLILFVAAPDLTLLTETKAIFIPDMKMHSWIGISSGAFLAFYAYVGFEDMVNVAEEVKNPSRNMPIAILVALSVATVMYILVAISALLVLTPTALSLSEAPLADVYEAATGLNPWLISVVSLFAVVNGALVQIIMASRVCYGLAKRNWLPDFIGRVGSKTQTPVNATAVLTALTIAAALWFPIETLAAMTTTLLLFIFTLVNIALVKIKRQAEPVENVFQVSILLPVVGSILCGSFLVIQGLSLLLSVIGGL